MSSPKVRWRKTGQLTFGVRYGCLAVLFIFFTFALLCSGLQGLAMFAMGPATAAFAAFLATLTAVPYTGALLWLDRNEKEPIYLVLIALLWGAIVATAVSMIFNTVFQQVALGVVHDELVAGQLTASFSAPFIEEFTKGLAVLFIFFLFHREFDDVLDGILYGALVGLGFAWFENITYYVMAAEGGTDDMAKLMFLRGVLSGVGSHAAYTGLTGLGFGLVRVLRKGVLRWLLVPIFWGTAMGAHFAWNTFVGLFIIDPGSEAMTLLVSMPLAVLVLQIPFVALLLLVVSFVWRHENRVITRYLEDEPADVSPAGQARSIVPARRRFWKGLRRFFGRGPLHWWRGRRLDQLLIRLAFAKWHHEKDAETTWSADEDGDIRRFRREIVRLRRVMS